jgi:putative ABC transport system substrate-binding protein
LIQFRIANPSARLGTGFGLRNWPAATIIVALALSILVVQITAEAQPAGQMYRLGILSPTAPASLSDQTTFLNRLPTALRELGYVEGQNLVVEWRYAEGKLDRLPALARELVQLRADVILAVSNPAIRAAKEATTTIPIVMFTAYDPVAAGLVASLARPGGNLTGVLIAAEGTLAGKRLELIREAVPQATRIALLAPPDPSARAQVQEAQKAAASLGVKLVVVEVQGGDYDHAFARIMAGRPGALFVLASTFFVRDRKQIIDLAAKHRLPAIYEWREHVEDGGLMAYGSSL